MKFDVWEDVTSQKKEEEETNPIVWWLSLFVGVGGAIAIVALLNMDS